jgi:KEOPS complex subunit Cgi121
MIMIKKIDGLNKYIAIAGFKNVKIENRDNLINTLQGSIQDGCIQLFNANLIAGWEHLFFAALNALKSFESKLNISNNLAIEMLLFASAQRQIKKAVKLLGIKPESSQIATLIIAETKQRASEALEMVSELICGERDDGVVELTDEKYETIKKLFEISHLEFKSKLTRKGLERPALIDLVIEHIALLATKR